LNVWQGKAMLGAEAAGAGSGTRFRVFPQPPFANPGIAPETIEVSSPAGSIEAGPADDRMYFVRPIGKRYPYGVNIGPLGTPWLFMPPWQGPIAPPVEPEPDGHFDHLEPGTDEFEAAHLFGVTRFVIDVWERYLGHPIRWHFARDFDRLELSILPGWDNGQIGYGYLEVGTRRSATGEDLPYALNFDIIAHEVGHGLIYAEVGMPTLDEGGEYFGFQEAAADWVALTTALHFPSVVRNLLETTHGNLYTYNEFNRFAEFSPNTQIRLADNFLKLSDFEDGWTDEHLLSQPLSGALFDIFVDIFHEALVETGVVRRDLEDLSDITENAPEREGELQSEFDRAYRRDAEGFVFALEDARDLMSELFIGSWRRISPGKLDYLEFADAMLAADVDLTGGRLNGVLINNFRWRDIGETRAGPRLRPPGRRSHSHSNRSAVPEYGRKLKAMTYRERYLLAALSPDVIANRLGDFPWHKKHS
jgi:hypothetical protein